MFFLKGSRGRPIDVTPFYVINDCDNKTSLLISDSKRQKLMLINKPCWYCRPQKNISSSLNLYCDFKFKPVKEQLYKNSQYSSPNDVLSCGSDPESLSADEGFGFFPFNGQSSREQPFTYRPGPTSTKHLSV